MRMALAPRLVAGLAAGLTLLAAGPLSAQETAPVASAAAVPEAAVTPKPVARAPAKAVARPVAPVKGVTPNAERDVAIGAINKRTGETKTFVGRPGQGFSFGSLDVVVRTCEVTPPWEQKLTGAFLLIDERLVKGPARRVYSGWMFAESPSLHPLEHPRYDIWVKSCAMRFPETGPDTVVAGKGDLGPASKGESKAVAKASKAKKSAVVPSAEAN